MASQGTVRPPSAPLTLAELIDLECRLAARMTTGDHSIFVGEILAVWMHETPKRLLCSIDQSSGYDFLLEKAGYRFGVVKT